MQASNPPAPTARLPFRELSSYCIGAVGSNVIYALIATYLMVFYTESLGLKAAGISAPGGLMVASDPGQLLRSFPLA